MQTNYDAVDKAALALSGALMLVGVAVLGMIEILAGKPYSPGQGAAIDANIRVGLVIAGLVVLLLWGLYRMVTAEPGTQAETTTPDPMAD